MPRMSLAKVATGVLQKELSRRLEALPRLIAERDELNRQIAELKALSPAAEAPKPTNAPAPKKRGRPVKRTENPQSLASTLAEIINAQDSMSVGDAAKAVLASGYKSKSKDFTNLVNITLSQNKQFQRVGRGVYRVKG